MIPEIANLPDVSFIDDATLQDVKDGMKKVYEETYEEAADEPIELEDADPMTLLLNACAVYIYQGWLYADRSGKMNLLKYSYGDYLDNLAAGKGIARAPAKPARVLMRFTLSDTRPDAIGIPQGTTVTDGFNYYATEEYAEIPIGDLTADVYATALKAGTDGNDPEVGDISILTEPIPYVASVENISKPSGGTDEEDDDDLTDQVYLAPSKYSVAGPEDAYIYWAKTYNTGIVDVYVDSSDPVDVTVEVLMDGGQLPDQNLLDGLQSFLGDENIRPLTDHVTVKAPDTVPYDLNVKYWINKSDTAKALTIQTAVNAAIDAYIIWQDSKIGRDINSSELIRRMVVAGAKRVEVTKPVYQVIPKASVGKIGTRNVVYGGIEDD